MNWRSIRAIAIKDLKEVRQNKAAWIPALVVPVMFAIIIPAVFSVLPQVISPADIQQEFGDMQQLIEKMPPTLVQIFSGMSLEQAFVVYPGNRGYGTGFLLAPLFLIMPLMFSTIVGADSFVGERERKTMEALLYTPASDGELFLGKALAAVVPAVLLSWLTYLVYGIVVNTASYPLMGRIWFPLPAWWPLMFWLTPAISVLGISATVLISSRVRTFMEAYQLSGSLVVLVLMLVAGQISGVLYLGVGTTILVGIIVWLIDAALLYPGNRGYISIRTFKRANLITKL